MKKLIPFNALVAWLLQLVMLMMAGLHGAMIFMVGAVPRRYWPDLLHPEGGGMLISLGTYVFGPFVLLALLVSLAVFLVARFRTGEPDTSTFKAKVRFEGPYWLLIVDALLFIGVPAIALLIR